MRTITRFSMTAGLIGLVITSSAESPVSRLFPTAGLTQVAQYCVPSEEVPNSDRIFCRDDSASDPASMTGNTGRIGLGPGTSAFTAATPAVLQRARTGFGQPPGTGDPLTGPVELPPDMEPIPGAGTQVMPPEWGEAPLDIRGRAARAGSYDVAWGLCPALLQHSALPCEYCLQPDR
jgi:hypothetical protein